MNYVRSTHAVKLGNRKCLCHQVTKMGIRKISFVIIAQLLCLFSTTFFGGNFTVEKFHESKFSPVNIPLQKNSFSPSFPAENDEYFLNLPVETQTEIPMERQKYRKIQNDFGFYIVQ